jgi:signal transduction histidine kinase
VTRFVQSMTVRVFVILVLGILVAIAGTLHATMIFHGPLFRPTLQLSVLGVCTLSLAFITARMVTRPLRGLAGAAMRLGRDIDAEPLPVTGPTEVKDASMAFNAMQQRIRANVSERTGILAAITHDLQTPVTRLRLRVEKVEDDELRARLIGDLASMSDMIREGLELARSIDVAEPFGRLDLDALLDSVCSDAQDAGHDVVLREESAAIVLGSVSALRRCFTNVIDNAVAYGGRADVSCVVDGARAIVRVRDSGPGLSDHQLGSVFDPFYRVEASRSRATGGTGLGLTITRNIVARHGGTVSLRNRAEGGLEVTLDLPLAGAE